MKNLTSKDFTALFSLLAEYAGINIEEMTTEKVTNIMREVNENYEKIDRLRKAVVVLTTPTVVTIR